MDFLQDKIKKKQFLCNYSVFLLNGMLALSIGSLLPFIRDARGLDYAFCGLIVSLHSVGNLFSSFTAGLLPVAIGRKKSILFFNLFFALSYVLIIFGNHNWCIAMAFFLTGVAPAGKPAAGLWIYRACQLPPQKDTFMLHLCARNGYRR